MENTPRHADDPVRQCLAGSRGLREEKCRSFKAKDTTPLPRWGAKPLGGAACVAVAVAPLCQPGPGGRGLLHGQRPRTKTGILLHCDLAELALCLPAMFAQVPEGQVARSEFIDGQREVFTEPSALTLPDHTVQPREVLARGRRTAVPGSWPPRASVKLPRGWEARRQWPGTVGRRFQGLILVNADGFLPPT